MRPNLLYLFGDEHRGQAIGYANPDVQSPVIDRLAAEGVRFTHAYANSPVCTPSRGSLLTGQWPWQHGAISNDLPVHHGPETPSIARALKGAGYRCGYIGKWHIGGWPRDRFTPPGPARLGFDDLWAAWECHHQYMRPKYHLNDSPDPVLLEGVYEPEVQTDLALAWLQDHLDGSSAAPDQPFCLFLSYGPPHDPYRPLPPGYEDHYDPASLAVRPNCADTPNHRRDLADYYAHVTALDTQIGRLISLLRERGVLDNTLVVYSSDHGTMLGSHGMTHKQQPWEESINIPLVMRFGDRLPRGTTNDLLIGIVDYAPTLLGLLDVPIPPAMQGHNLAPHILGQRDDCPESVYLTELICCDQAVRLQLQPWRGVRTARYTYARDINGPWVLYDNDSDPYQRQNLATTQEGQPLREELERELAHWMERTGDQLEPASEVLERYDLAEAWGEREAHFQQLREKPRGQP